MFLAPLALLLSMAAAAAPDSLETAERHLTALVRADGDFSEEPTHFEARSAYLWAGGTTVRVTQRLAGLPVEGREVAVALDSSGAVRRVHGLVVRSSAPDPVPVLAATEAEALAQWTVSHLGAGALWPTRSELVVHIDRDAEAHLAWAVDASIADPPTTFRVLVDAHSGLVLDTTPTSRTADGNVYPQGPELSEVTRVGLAGLTDGTALSGEYADVYSCSDWVIEESLFGVTQCNALERQALPDVDGHFLYSPAPDANTDPFGEVQLYHHLDLVSDWYAVHYGFTHAAVMQGIVNFPMTNAFYGDFDGDGTGDVSFGHSPGGIDFGYDPDVVYHEFGHSVVHTVSTIGYLGADEFGMLWDGGSLDEGMADTTSLLINGDPLMGEYAGTIYGPGGTIRDLTEPRRCPDDLLGEVHADGEVWGATIWQLIDDPEVGAAVTRELTWGAMTTWTLETTWNEAGTSLLTAADDLLDEGVIDAGTHVAIIGHVDAANLVDCERVQVLQDRQERSLFVLNAGLSGDFEVMPAGVQLAFEVPEDATGLRLEVLELISSSTELGYRVHVRRGEPVAHRVTDLALLGLDSAVPETFDFAVDGDDVGDPIELTLDSDPPLVPGETYYFAFAGTNLGGIPFFEFTYGLLNARLVLFDVVEEEEPKGCGCGGDAPVPWWGIAVLFLGLRRRRSTR